MFTPDGWVGSAVLDAGDAVLCQPYIGLPFEPFDLPPSLVRLVAYVSGDGHLTTSGKVVSIYTTVEDDATALADDFRQLGHTPAIYGRNRHPNRRTEINVCVHSVALHRLLRELGSPVARKRWDRRQLAWVLEAPAWVRASFLSAFASAEMTTPRLDAGRMTNLAIKQKDPVAARFVVELAASLSFRCSLVEIAGQQVVQILGGEDEQLRFCEEVGFNRAVEKRRAAARAASVAWQRRDILRRRRLARQEAELLHAGGSTVRDITSLVAQRFDVPRGFVHHALYSGRPLRRGLGWTAEPLVLGEGAWVGVHFGSRGFGHKTASGFLALAQGLAFGERAHEGEMDSPPVLFEVGSELGDAYISAMELAGEYAYAGRDIVVAKVLEILGAEAVHEVHNHHNFAWREEHGGRTYRVVRKGCTPAEPGQEGFVGGSMGDISVILEGTGNPLAGEALNSTVHGAGRVMSRTQAAGRVRRRKRWACSVRDCPQMFETEQRCSEHRDAQVRKVWVEEQLKPGIVDWPAVQNRLREQGIVLVGGGADEAPEVYKRLPDVLAAHGDSIRIKHTLRPLGVAMAGRDVVDPYKD